MKVSFLSNTHIYFFLQFFWQKKILSYKKELDNFIFLILVYLLFGSPLVPFFMADYNDKKF